MSEIIPTYSRIKRETVVLATVEVFAAIGEDGILSVQQPDGTMRDEIILEASEPFEHEGVMCRHGFLLDPGFAEREARWVKRDAAIARKRDRMERVTQRAYSRREDAENRAAGIGF